MRHPTSPSSDELAAARSGRWVRSARAAVVELGDSILLVARDGTVRRLDGDTASLAREVLALFATPATVEGACDAIEALAGPLGERRAVVRQLIELLADTGAIAHAASPQPGLGANVVVGVSGALAATHVPALVSALQQRGHAVEVALTPTAARFVARDALAAIAQREPHASLWPRAAHEPVPHVALAAWAELVVIYPASATTIARIANGDFSDLVAAIALVTAAPVIVVPSMNAAMLASPAVQRNLERLRRDGFAIVGGVPSHEAAEAPSVREAAHPAAPPPGEVAATIDALRAAGVLAPRATSWDAAYRRPLVPWASETCDADLAAALAAHAPKPCRVLDIGCGLGQVARHAAAAGHRVVATDVSDVALSLARTHESDIVWLRDDICASALAGPFDVIVDRAVLHVLPAERTHAWAATVRRLAARDAVVIVKCHATAFTGAALAELLDFELVGDSSSELPGIADATPIPSRLVVLRRHSSPR